MLHGSLNPLPMGLELPLGTAIRYQTLLGFGGAFTDASGELRPMELKLFLGAANRFRLSLALVAPSLMLQVS
jgi:hypothetical protein